MREFYAYYIPVEDQSYLFMSMVRGRPIYFNRDAINAYLGNPLTLEDGALCEYEKRLDMGNWNIEMVKEKLVRAAKSYEVNVARALKNFLRKNLTTKAHVLMTLVLYNIRPRSHTSTIPLNTTYILYYILDDRHIDVARIVANMIKMITGSRYQLGSKTPSTLVFPGLVMGL